MRNVACAAAVLGALSLIGPAFAGAPVTQKTASYAISLTLGPKETMFTPAEVKAKHLKSGEVMIGGSMAMDMSSGMGGAVRHLEVHITSRATGKAITNLTPKIAVADRTTKALSDVITVVKMQGVGAPASDIHFGNNVDLHLGHAYTVAVAVGAEETVFHFVAK